MAKSPSQEELLTSLQSSLQTIQKLKARLAAHEEPIAVIGMGCRLPGGVQTIGDFWQLLTNGVDAIGEVPATRWNVDALYDPNPAATDKIYTRQGGFLDQIDEFDPQFFGISPREAVSMDPQQRLLLEVAWEALENARQVWDRLQGNPTGVFIGISGNDYVELLKTHSSSSSALEGYFITGNALNAAAGRLSYILGLQGPSMAIDTACSSSLVAIHLACQSLRQHECRTALAGGVNLMLTPQAYIALSRIQALSPDGRCKSFDASADGYGRGEGCGIVVLKRLADAQADGDPILAVIRGSAVNQDGPSSGLTVPNGPAQQALIRQALANAQVNPHEVGYVEAHGTGTPLGDPIEVEALGAVFAKRQQPLLIGSVKSNLGHLEAAAGVTALIKVVLSLQHGYIPPHLHLNQPNPRIAWHALPLQVATHGTPWPTEKRIAGVSSFGFSGTNAHVVLEAAGEMGRRGDKGARGQGDGVTHDSQFSILNSQLLTLSAKSEAALWALAGRYAAYLTDSSATVELADVALAANTGRAHFRHRLAVLGNGTEDVKNKLVDFASRSPQTSLPVLGLQSGEALRNRSPKIAFLFTGQGAQYPDMGRQLYESHPLFRQTLDRCDAILRPLLGESLLAILYPDKEMGRWGDGERGRWGDKVRGWQGDNSDDQAEPRVMGNDPLIPLTPSPLTPSPLSQTLYTQPALFALEYALAQLWLSWGITPSVVMGHSVGEYVAACVAGIFSLEDGLTLIAERARLMQALPQDGTMVAMRADEAQVQSLIAPYREQVSIAAINGPQSMVISGQQTAVQAIISQFQTLSLERQGGSAGHEGKPTKGKIQNLNVSHAFHSPLMQPMLDAFTRTVAQVTMQAPRIPFVSNLTGDLLPTGMIPDATYWRRHTREAVRFHASIETLLRTGCDCFLEIGPKPVLTGLGRQITEAGQWLPSLQAGQDDWQTMLTSLATLYVQGATVNWATLAQANTQRRISDLAPLPTYPFQRKRYWIHEKEDPSMLQTQTATYTGSNGTTPQRYLQLQQELATLLAGTFQVEPSEIRLDIPFLEMGADSIVLVNAVRTIEGTYGVKISMRQFFEELSTLESLASYLDHHLPAAWGQPASATVAVTPPHPVVVAAPLMNGQHVNSHSTNGHSTNGHNSTGHNEYTAANGHTPAPAQQPTILPLPLATLQPATLSPAPLPPATDAVERILRDQLAVMSQQLQVLGGVGQHVAPASPPQQPVTISQPPAQASAPAPASAKPAATSQPNAFAAWKKPTTQSAQLDARQQKHLDALIARYTARTQRSKALTQQYRQVLSDNRSSAGFRPSIKEMLYPLMGERGAGAHVWDVDGNEYIDITMGFGALLHGHAPAFVNEAVAAQLQLGVGIGPQTALAGEVASLVCELTGMERVTFCNSGTEAIMTALRIARTQTKRNKVAYFMGSYHGHNDITLGMAEGGNDQPNAISIFPGVTDNTLLDAIVLDYGNPQSLEVIRAHAHELAAVLVEPVQSRRPELQPKEFVQQLRQVTRELGIGLIFDETITGFRIRPGGAQAWYEVDADLAIYGKVAGGGLPLGLVAGRTNFMDRIDGGFWQYGDASHPQVETTFFAGTFSKHPLTMAATRAALQHLKEQGPALQERLNQRTAYLAETLNAWFAAEAVPIQIVYFGSLFRFVFKSNMDLFFYHLLDKGIFVWEGRNNFLSTEHSDADLLRIIEAVQETVDELRNGGFLPEPPSGTRRTLPLPPLPAALAKKNGMSGQNGQQPAATQPAKRSTTVDFSLYYFGHYEATYRSDKYDLLLESVRFADQHGFAALWMPERHFHPFGGISPNPSILCAALARETQHLQLRAGSVVLPLHHPIRVAEDWSIIDNLSQGRVGISFASGWHPNDFVFAPEAFGKHRDQMFEFIGTVQKLWQGQPVAFRNGAGNDFTPTLHPQPKQKTLPTWVTIVKNPDTYQRAGAIGANVLTNLMGQTVEELAQNILLYRQARAENGHDPATGRVTVLLHTFIGADLQQVRQQARRPFYNYLNSSIGLFKSMAQSMNLPVDLDTISADDKEYFLGMVYDRYVQHSALIGTPDSCVAVVDNLLAIGVNEIACFIDFGVDARSVMTSLPAVNDLRARYETNSDSQTKPAIANEISLPPAQPATLNSQLSTLNSQLTSAQQQIWVLAQLDAAGSVAYNDFVAFQLKGLLQHSAMQRALQQVVERHEALRTTIDKMGNEQVIWPVGSDLAQITLPVVDFSNLPASGREDEIQRWFQQEGQKPLDLTHGPIFGVHLLKQSETEHLLALRAHHTIIDGWSWGVIFQELGVVYSALTTGKSAALPSVPLQFRQFVDWQNAQRSTPAMQEHEAFWLQQFGGPLPVLDLPADRPQPATRSYQGSRAARTLSADVTMQLKQLSRKQGCTLFMTLLAGFSTLLHRLSGQDDLVIGTPVGGRFSTGSEAMVGYVTHLLPVRSRVAEDETFLSHLKAVRGNLLTAFEHQEYPFAWLLDKVNQQPGTTRTPLVTVTFNLDQPLLLPALGELQSRLYPLPVNSAIFDLTLNVIEVQNELLLYCDYNRDIFDAETVERYLGHYQTLLGALVATPQENVWRLPLLNEVERQQLLVAWNDTAAAYPEQCVHELFEEQVKRIPDATAFLAGDRTLSYAELDVRANQLAHHLIDLGVQQGDLVGICLERSEALPVGLLGILKAGAAYVPLDPAYPSDRLAYMLTDSGAQVMVTQRSLATSLPINGRQVVYLDEFTATAEAQMQTAPPIKRTLDDLLYVLYTSGSTGQPKGVQGTQRGAVNRLQWMWDAFPFAAGEVACQKTALSFVDSVWECFGPLLAGIPSLLIPDAVVKNPQRLVQMLAEYKVTRLVLVPSLLRALLETYPDLQARLPQLRFWVCSGEALSSNLCQRFYQQLPQSKLLNLYGSSEVAGDVTCYDTSNAPTAHQSLSGVPIGRPLSNTQLYILDRHSQPVPIGIPGEVYAGGAHVARGYHNRPQLTQEKFIANPFGANGRLYHMGDRARYLPDGTIEYLGRKDFQVKVRGFRVELGEIEAILADHPAVREVVVTARAEQTGGQQIVAYLVGQGETSEIEAIRRYVAEKLPEYMRPAAYVTLAAFPLTPSGKVDRRSLPDPDIRTVQEQAGVGYVAPRSETEGTLAQIWGEVLARPAAEIGVEDNFFAIGGHSLRAVQVINRVQEAFAVELALDTLFEKQNIAQLAEAIEIEQLTQVEGAELARLLAEME